MRVDSAPVRAGWTAASARGRVPAQLLEHEVGAGVLVGGVRSEARGEQLAQGGHAFAGDVNDDVPVASDEEDALHAGDVSQLLRDVGHLAAVAPVHGD